MTFELGDQVRLAVPIAGGGREPVGTVTGFVTPAFAAHVDAPDDVRVQWDIGLEHVHAPATLVRATADNQSA